MKPFFLIISIISLGLVSCKENNVKTTEQKENSIKTDEPMVKPVFSYDSLAVEDSVKVTPNLTLQFRKKVLTFSGLEKKVLDSIYKDELFSKDSVFADYSVNTIKKALETKKQNYFKENKESLDDYSPEYPQIWDQVSTMGVYSKQNDFLTIQYTGFGYSGGAHGYDYENYKIVDLKNQKKVELKDLVSNPEKIDWHSILMKHFPSKEQKEMILVDKISANNNFYFDEKNLHFVFGQYEIAAYAAGIIDVAVPFSEISNTLNPEFKKRMNLK